MSNHRIHYAGFEPNLQARCSCGKRSAIGSRADCDQWQYEHLGEIQRIRAHLGTRNPTLKSTAAWFASQAADADLPNDERDMWQRLADEAGAYIARKNALLEQDTLF